MSEDGDDESCESQDNELEYDDMFLRDNDLGSDAGSDGEVMARVAMRVREGEERIGCRFIQSRLKPEGSNSSADTTDVTSGLISSATNDAPAVSYMYDTQIRSSLKFNDGHFLTSAVSATRSGQAEAGYDNESIRLSSYTAVVYAQALSHIPYLGASADSKLPANKEKKQTQGQTTITTINNQSSSSTASLVKHTSLLETTATTTPAVTATTTAIGDMSVGNRNNNNDDMVTSHSRNTTEETAAATAIIQAPGDQLQPPTSSTQVSLEQSILMPLIEFIHGKKDNLEKLVTDFTTARTHAYSKALTRRVISDIADKVRHTAGSGSPRWVVKQEVLDTRLTPEDRLKV